MESSRAAAGRNATVERKWKRASSSSSTNTAGSGSDDPTLPRNRADIVEPDDCDCEERSPRPRKITSLPPDDANRPLHIFQIPEPEETLPGNRYQKILPYEESANRTEPCERCRALPLRLRRRGRRIATSAASRIISLSEMTTLLLLYYLGTMSAPPSVDVAAAATASTKEKAKASSMKDDKDSEIFIGPYDEFDFVGDDDDYGDYDEDIYEDLDYFDDDAILEDLLLSDFDSSLDTDGEEEDIQERMHKVQEQLHHPKLKVRTASQPNNSGDMKDDGERRPDSEREGDEKDSVIILTAVDGTLAGISRSSGRVLWKQSRDSIVTHDKSDKPRSDGGSEASGSSQSVAASRPPVEWNKFLSPLVSTTASAKSPDNNLDNVRHQWHAVPSIDGTVYLTSGEQSNNSDGGGRELSMVTDIRDLVDRAPFVDAHQRFFVGSRRAMVAAVDERTGEILRVIPKWKGGSGDDGGDGDDEGNLPPSLEGRDVVWIGRLEHTVTVHDLHKGTVDVEFSVAEILSVDEMIHGSAPQQPLGVVIHEEEEEEDEKDSDAIARREEDLEAVARVERLFTDYITEALRHPSNGDRILQLPAPDEGDSDEDAEDYARGKGSGSSPMSHRGGPPFLVSTPGGHVAFRDSEDSSSTVGWVSFHLLDSPVVYAIEASSGHKIRVNMLPDDASAVSPPVDGGSSEDGSLPLLLLEQQIASLEQSSSSLLQGVMDEACIDGDGGSGKCRAVGFSARGSVVGALENGHIYALPLGKRVRRYQTKQSPLGLPQPGHHHTIASEHATHDYHKQSTKMNTHHVIGFHEHRHDSSVKDVDAGDGQRVHLDTKSKQSCTPSSPLYPGCLIGAGLIMNNLLDVNGNLDMASVFESSDLDFDLYLDMYKKNKNKTLFQQFMKIMSSWIAPTVALLFVVSFEIGRRERIKAEAASSNAELSPNGDGEKAGTSAEEKRALLNSSKKNGGQQNGGGVIQLSDEILGYGGHGTVVYRGVLDGRSVAVKRLLSAYHASADREISLLIESDGHPNVVRYFLKEMRGDFVYLALELCDMSLNDLIVSLSKLRNVRKENFQLHHEGGKGKDDFESATKSLLFQIASGVRHIHSLRIVHRDLKPQNILLALRGKSKSLKVAKSEEASDSETEIDETAHSACSETNTILESFKNRDYVPKISDMGLGKQLAGQSSFGLSTLGTGSVGGGDGGGGPGAGSVGWQAPEVMAMRWSPELSNEALASTELINTDGSEASPMDGPGTSAVRTSRSVDIFSLGCVFYCTILPGSHPFGEWYEREANIMKNAPNKEDLEFVSPDASDLILSMIHRDAKARPTAAEVCEHPFFWSLGRRLKFLCDLSDRIELCDATNLTALTPSTPPRGGTKNAAEGRVSSPATNIFAIEKGAAKIFGTSWEKRLDPDLVEASLNRRTYDPSSVRDCLRMIRNKHHHYDELPAKVKSRIGSSTDGLSSYIARSFPRLLMHCYHFCVANLAPDDSLAMDYQLPVARYLSLHSKKSHQIMKKTVIADLSVLEETKSSNCPPLETIPDDDNVEQEHEEREQGDDGIRSSSSKLDADSGLPVTEIPTEQREHPPPKVEEPPAQRVEQMECTPPRNDHLSGIVVWSGSNTAKELNCRGWYRSDEEWTQRLDAKLRSKRDTNLALRCVEDPKFRTRLCNHWDVSGGTFCPMRKKNKCIFAHGPAELRVKEGKRMRWGTLVNKTTGLCANPRASGGEDTYGAARSIEKTRKEQGEWKVDSTGPKKQGKGKPNKGGKQQPPKKKKEQT